MNEEMNDKKQLEFKDYYRTLSGYIEYCLISVRTRLTDKEKEGMSPEEINKKEEALRAESKKREGPKETYQKFFVSMCEAISQGGLPALDVYTDALIKLYSEKSEWKREIKSVLVSYQSQKLFNDARKDIIGLYSILKKVNDTFPIDDYPHLSLSPKAAMYGSEVNKTKNGSSIKLSPFKNEEYQRMLDLFLQMNDSKRFNDWLMAILIYDPDCTEDVFKEEFAKEREKLKNWAYEQISREKSYKQGVTKTLMKKGFLKQLFDAYLEIPVLKKKKEELEIQIQTLEESNKKEADGYEERRIKQLEIIRDQESSIATYQEKLKQFERAKVQLTSYIKKYETQVDMNERITMANKELLRKMGQDCDLMQSELTDVKGKLETLTIEHTALEADYSLKNSELNRLKANASQKEKSAQVNLMKELVTGINEQFYYLTMFYLDLRDTGHLGSESIGLFGDTLNNIDSSLARLGIRKFGKINEKAVYDSTLHICADSKIANGEEVVVSGYGWKIGDEVYIKAPVEKGVQ